MAIHIVVDGYNLIRQSPSLSTIDALGLQRGREELIKRLSQYRRIKRHPITVVFDGWRGENPHEVKEKERGINIIFSRHGEKADDVIKRIAAKQRERIVVVTSDHEVADFSQRHGAAIINSRDFDMRMEIAFYPHIKGVEEYSQSPSRISTKKRGSPRRLSKRERRNKVKIRKL